jgi:hypothetical protein
MDRKKYYQCPMKCEGDKTYDEPGKCPVCNMHLDPVEEQNRGNHTHTQVKENHHHDHQHKHGHHVVKNERESGGKYFCPMRCEEDKTYDEPGDCPVCGMDLKKEEARPTPVGKKTIYTCPMHPEVKQDHPGSCPKCGMDLVPENAEETSEDEKAY